MISNRWQRRAPKGAPEDSDRGILSRSSKKIGSFLTSVMFESVDPVSTGLPAERQDNGPFGMVGPNTLTVVRESINAVGRTAASPFGALVTVTIADELIRVLTARGNRVRAWAETDLPNGVVQDGLIVDEQTFIEALSEVLSQVTRNGKLRGQKVAIAITGRNLVQRRLTVYVGDDQEIAEAIIAASTESMSIRTDEMQIEWDAEALDFIEPDEEELDENEAEGGDDDDGVEGEPFDSPPQDEADNPTTPTPDGTEELGLENLDLELEPEPDGEPYDVYALALYKHVIRRNLRTVSEFGARFAGVQPKILALAAAVNSRAAVVLDFEANTLVTAVISNGLPEVIREVGIDPYMNQAKWVNLITTQISRAIAFYDSIFPDDPLETNVDIFVTGQAEQAKDAVDEALERLPFVRSELPQTLRAPDEFSFDRYAANVGLVIVSGKRFWQRTPVPLLPTPKFDYRPANYRPRPLPWRAALKVAAALVLGLGVLGLSQAITEQSDSVARAEYRLAILENQNASRSVELEKVREARILLDEARLRTERLIAANDLIQDRAAGFATTMSVIAAAAQSDIRVTVVDDDGMIVLVEAEATEYSMLLGYIRLLDDLPQFERVQILGLSQLTDADSGVSLLFSAQSGGETIDQSVVKMSIEITRIELETDEDQNFSDEELAVAGNQDTVPVPQ
ncbi:MAG: hypothetical protein J4O01_04670 [Chloroflexi bacterium]|nr:hypothetical protein [Chloroflexota bacterium]